MTQHTAIAAKSSPTPCFSGGAGNGAASDQKPARHRGNLANLVALLMEQPKPQLPLDFYSGPPDPGDRFYLAFTLDTPEEHAAGVFARRYGRPPEFVFESRGNLLCGPIPEVL